MFNLSHEQMPSRAFVRGLAGGALVMTLFGTAWAAAPAGILTTTSLATGLAFTIVGIVAVVLLAGCYALARSAQHISVDSSPEAAARSKAIGKRLGIGFGIVFGSEVVIIAVASSLLSATGQGAFIVPVVVLVIGLHFLPLAALFQVRPYYVTGVLLSLAAIVTLLVVPKAATVNQVEAWVVIPATCSALILWLTAVAVLALGRRAVRMLS
jgi:hypothetical protein